ncbi:MAG: TrpB-like pyridoxal phosphate-dependent enzyme [Bacteroidales bacterium]|nr:TrpB-like pyridoxal phosphate-dependent enzyme [Bacteroidales bacterium]
MKTTKKYTLPESEIPQQWYNIMADMPNAPQPLLSPKTRKPLEREEMEMLFAKELVAQEFSRERFIDIPEEVQTLLKIYRPSPLVRASGLEKALDTPARIYFKNESVSPVGSHKLNSAIPQAYYNAKQGIKHITTETGAGQWGSAMSIACKHFGLDLNVFMVKNSYNMKPYRKMVMSTYGAQVHASPSEVTEFGRGVLASDPDCGGALGIAISEAVEMAMKTPDCRYTLGSVLNHVLLHQTIIGLEAEKQMAMAGDYPDKVIACFGGGSNFAGLVFPFLRHKLAAGAGAASAANAGSTLTADSASVSAGNSCLTSSANGGAPSKAANTKFMAAEPASCPKLTKGVMEYDFGDSAGMTPLIPMYTLGHDFQPDQIHAAGLRYHGGGQLVSQLKQDGFIDSYTVDQREALNAGVIFSRAEGIIPAPESTHAIALTIREALRAKESGTEEVILFNLSGHGLLDLPAYDLFLNGKI